jgi:hypothetical protein
MKSDRMPLAVLVAGILIAGAILTNGYLERTANDPTRLVPTKEEIQKALGQSMHLYRPPSPGQSHSVNGPELRGFEITKVQPSEDGRKVRVELTFSTVDKKAGQSAVILERDEFGQYTGTLQHEGARGYIAVRH